MMIPALRGLHIFFYFFNFPLFLLFFAHDELARWDLDGQSSKKEKRVVDWVSFVVSFLRLSPPSLSLSPLSKGGLLLFEERRWRVGWVLGHRSGFRMVSQWHDCLERVGGGLFV